MNRLKNENVSRQTSAKGDGLINTLINKLPIELHLPGYQYCGPGTKLDKRLARGDLGINELDKACKEHDIAYSQYKDSADRHKADKVLGDKAWQRVKSKDSNLRERSDAFLVSSIMKAKTKLGMGAKKQPLVSLQYAIKNAKKELRQQKPDTVKKSIKLALVAAKKVTKNKKYVKTPRIIPIPKVGGIIPLLVPIFAGLSAAGALAGGAAGIAKAVIAANEAKKQLKESQRHNETMESIAMGKGLFLKPYKTGLGLYLHPSSKN